MLKEILKMLGRVPSVVDVRELQAPQLKRTSTVDLLLCTCLLALVHIHLSEISSWRQVSQASTGSRPITGKLNERNQTRVGQAVEITEGHVHISVRNILDEAAELPCSNPVGFRETLCLHEFYSVLKHIQFVDIF